MLSGLVGNIRQLESPEIPGEPASFKADEDLWGHSRHLLSRTYPVHLTMMGRPPRYELAKGRLRRMSFLARESPQDQPPSESDEEEVTEIVISGDDDISIPGASGLLYTKK